MGYIECNNLNYKYPLNNQLNLKNINFSVEKGEFIGIVGENGAGKTSLCHALRGFIPNFFNGELSGEVLVEGIDIKERENYINLASKIGYVFQNPFTQMSGIEDTVYDEIAFGLENTGVNPNEIDKRIKNVLKELNLMDLINKNPFELSGGQQQRLAFACVLAMEPDIYIIDEPTSQLDPKSANEIFSILNILKEKGKTIFLVEHNVDLLSEYATRIFVMDKGEIVEDAKPLEVFTNGTVSSLNIDIPKNIILGKKLKEWLGLSYTPITKEEIRKVLEENMKGRK